MTLKNTPQSWKRGFQLYRRRVKWDSLGNESVSYPDEPDLVVEAQDGICFQSPRGWNASGNVGKNGWQVFIDGEHSGGVLEGFLKAEPVLNPFDRLDIDGTLWEVRATHRWPGHRQVLLQRVR